MKRSTSFLVKVALMAAALALAVVFVGREADSPAAEATSYNPQFNVSVSDPTPGAPSDLMIYFSVDAPDSFPNVRTDSTIQFIPKQWGIHTDAPVGAYAGTFNALTTLGLLGTWPCAFPIPVPFKMYEATTDTSDLTSALDIGGDVHPGGLGYSGQFAQDPDTFEVPGDLGLDLISFNADEKHDSVYGLDRGYRTGMSTVYRDVDGSNNVSAGDIRLIDFYDKTLIGFIFVAPAGSTVQPGDVDEERGWSLYNFDGGELHSEVDVNGQMDPGETLYRDVDGSGDVSYGDERISRYSTLPSESIVEDLALNAGITRYPDFLTEMFPPEEVGEPLARQWGAQNVLGTTMVSLNLVTFRPGQLPGYPASLGYPTVTVLLNPVAPIEMASINMSSDQCAPLALTSTNFGVSQDNPATLADESGYVRLTNPHGQKDHVFTMVTTSQPDADDDGIENMLDTCPFDPNVSDDGRTASDEDALDDACDPGPGDEGPAGGGGGLGVDQDQDNYANRGDNCAVTPNGAELLGYASEEVPGFTFFWAVLGDLIGPDNQADTDGDDIGDACEGSEHGAQCLNDADDDADGSVNDGCPRGDGEGGDQCLNNADDDGDGIPNDGCPTVVGTAETGDQCLNDTDDDDDGIVNEGCPQVVGVAESGDQCLNETDDDGDGWVNEGCPRVIGPPESGDQCLNDQDDDDDGRVNDGCPAVGAAEWGWRCRNAVDDDGDGYINDGCDEWPSRWESGYAQCSNDVDDDGDGYVNDGCPYGEGSEPLGQCSNNLDNDFDGVVNDGCPAGEGPETEAPGWNPCRGRWDDDNDGAVNDGCPPSVGTNPRRPRLGTVESGAECENALDDDSDGVVNDGCPSVDPGDVAKKTITGHMHTVTLTESVGIYKHGIRLDSLGGPKKVQDGGARNYSVSVSNLSDDTSEEIQVALRVAEGCATVNGGGSEGTAVVSVGPEGTDAAEFTVDWTGCPAEDYTVQADACHAGDEDAGFFGVGDCPGVSDGMVDNNPLDDAPRSKIVTVGSP